MNLATAPIPLRRSAKPGAGLFDEMIVDNFAGGGGASRGIEAAVGRCVDVAINHDSHAVWMHQFNHPHTRHLCESVWDVDPVEVTAGRPVGLAWFSPDCKHFSRAKGGKPVEKKIRGLAWVVIKWAKLVAPRVILLENVREFQTWGPLTKDGRPCPKRKGITFRRWVAQLRNLGYAVEWRELNAADYGAPTHRRRLFLIARRDDRPIVWPEPTHGPGRPRPYRTAAECIDWSIPCPSIFLSKAEAKAIGVIRPLADKTMRRIALGLRRYVIENPNPFIIRIGVHDGVSGPVIEAADRPSASGEESGGVPASLVAVLPAEQRSCSGANEEDQGGEPAEGAGSAKGRKRDKARAHAEGPVRRLRYDGEGSGASPRLQQAAGGGVVVSALPRKAAPFAINVAHGEKGRWGLGAYGLNAPLGTITAQGKNHALVSAFLAKHYGGVVGHGPERPLGTVTAVDHHSVVAAHMVKNNHGEKQWAGVDEPLRTVVAGGTHHGVATSHLVKLRGQCTGSAADEPAPTVTANGNHLGAVRAFLMKFYGSGGQWQECGEPLHTIPSVDRFGVVMVDGEPHVITDIGMRMLEPRELLRAQFGRHAKDYVLMGPKWLQVKMIGNSVCPELAEALVKANYAAQEMCGEFKKEAVHG